MFNDCVKTWNIRDINIIACNAVIGPQVGIIILLVILNVLLRFVSRVIS